MLFHGETIAAFGVDQLLGRAASRLPKPISFLPIPASTNAVTPADLSILAPVSFGPHNLDAPIDLKAQMEGIELERIQATLGRADGVISEAARLLTLKRTTLIEKMRKYGVDHIALQ